MPHDGTKRYAFSVCVCKNTTSCDRQLTKLSLLLASSLLQKQITKQQDKSDTYPDKAAKIAVLEELWNATCSESIRVLYNKGRAIVSPDRMERRGGGRSSIGERSLCGTVGTVYGTQIANFSKIAHIYDWLTSPFRTVWKPHDSTMGNNPRRHLSLSLRIRHANLITIQSKSNLP